MRLAEKIATMARRGEPPPQMVWEAGKGWIAYPNEDGYRMWNEAGISAGQIMFRVDGGHSITWENTGSQTSHTHMLFFDENKKYVGYYTKYNSRTVDAFSESFFMLICCETSKINEMTIFDNTAQKYLFKNNEILAPLTISTEGGGTKCLTPRRSYRRSLRPSARFCAHSQEWEVAA